MNPIFQQLIIETIRKRYKRKNKKLPSPNDKSFREEVNDFKVEIQHETVDLFYLCIGVLSAAFGLESFLIPSSFIDGGVTGISLIVNELTGISLPLLLFFINLPFLLIAFRVISKRFALKSILGITLLALAVEFIHFPVITEDVILVATFGGLFLGLGIGLAIRGGAIIDGTEVLAIYISRHSSLSVGNVILIFNLFIFLTASQVFSTEIALYAILTYFAASKTVDFVIDGIEEYVGVTIVSHRSEDLRILITEGLGRGCTIYKGQSGYAKGGVLPEIDIVYTVITRLEISKIKKEIDKIDSNAFMIMTTVMDTRGGMIKKKPISKIK